MTTQRMTLDGIAISAFRGDCGRVAVFIDTDFATDPRDSDPTGEPIMSVYINDAPVYEYEEREKARRAKASSRWLQVIREIRFGALFLISCYAQAFTALVLLTALYGLWCREWIGALMIAGFAVPLYVVYRVADHFFQRTG